MFHKNSNLQNYNMAYIIIVYRYIDLSKTYSKNNIQAVQKEYPFKWAHAYGTSKTLEKGKLSDKNNA